VESCSFNRKPSRRNKSRCYVEFCQSAENCHHRHHSVYSALILDTKEERWCSAESE